MLRLWKYLNIDHNLGTFPFPLIPPFPTLANKCDQAGLALLEIYQQRSCWTDLAQNS